MDATGILWLSGLIAGTTYMISTYSTSYAFQHPIQTSVLTLLTTGIIIILSSWLSSSYAAPRAQEYPLTSHIDKTKTHASRCRNVSFSYQSSRPLSQRKAKAAAVVVVLLLCVRVEILRRVINNSQCSKRNLAFLIPIVITLHEKWTSRATSETVQTRKSARSWTARLFELILMPAVLSSGLLSLSSLLAASAYAMPHSSYICAHHGSMGWVIPLLQNIGVVLDGVLLVVIDALVFGTSEEPMTAKRTSLLGWISVATSVLLFVSGLNPWITPQYRWFMVDFSGIYLTQAMCFIIVSSFTAFCGLRVLCWIGAARTSSLITFICVYISSNRAALQFRHISSPVSSYVNLLFLTLAGIGLSLTLRKYSSNFPDMRDLMKDNKNLRLDHRALVALVVFCALPVGLWVTRMPRITVGHPIEMLITLADNDHEAWARQASASASLNEAAANYRGRYGRDPPPNFDHWYKFATHHDSLIIDDFDNIFNDVLPFWSLPPVKIRQRTLEAIANPWNNMAGIMIRGGTVTVSDGTPISHDWMMNGTADMIRPFAPWLPDMDLAFNLNDEGRVAIPHDSFQPILQTAIEAFRAPTSTGQTFSPFHLRNWPPIPENPITTTRFFERSWHPTWSEFGSITCAHNSPARTHHSWDFSYTTPAYLSPHTYHTYLSNYSLSFSTCHQPDLAHLHGLHMSPAAFKGTYDLVPVFSQSKAGGFNDIRYPSAWNYVGRERTIYAPNSTHPDPPFAEKEQTLFWRGGTTEGVSAFETGSWQGMARQRMVWLFENADDNDGVRHVVYLPTESTTISPQQQITYNPQLINPSMFNSHIHTNISLHIPTSISRCADSSCNTQHLEFSAAKYRPIDFQEHWRYKYLLDMDGAGFSGRFLPFLQSGSVVLKMGVVREWWEGRVWAWRDFVPLDIRGHEAGGVVAFLGGWRSRVVGTTRGEDEIRGHEAGGVVAFLGGWRSRVVGTTRGEDEIRDGNDESDWLMPPRDDVAQGIARHGQRTANTMLRKVDMEIYMFRLLLEWGRVVDDDREQLGWRGDLG